MHIKHLIFTSLIICLFSSIAFSQVNKATETVKAYVKANQTKLGVTEREADNLFITHEYTDETTGIQHIYAIQKLNGITITNTSFGLHTSGNKTVDASRLVALKNYATSPAQASISSSDAVSKVFAATKQKAAVSLNIKQEAQGTDLYTIYRRSASPIWDIPCRLVYYNNIKYKWLVTAWEVQMMDEQKRHYWLAYVDASNGTVIEVKDLIQHCSFDANLTDKDGIQFSPSNEIAERDDAPAGTQQARGVPLPQNQYRVYNMPYENPIDPGSTHSLSSKSGDILASPDGWHAVNNKTVTYNYARGNNVWAFQDPSPGPLGGVPSADPTRTAYPTNTTLGVPPVAEPFVFDYPIDLNNQPQTYQNAAIVNLFYWNNLMHDVFYYMGFTEAAGNFEESHTFSTGAKTGGNSGDAVLAQAQDGGGTNNANFLTLTDGTNGQMQMYLWSTAKPDSLVQIVSSTSGPKAGTKYIAIQGQLNSLPTGSVDLYANPVLNKQLVLIKKNALSTVGTDEQGCTTGQQSVALPPANDVNGKIAVIQRGNCSFVEKVFSAQQGGAVGVIIVNNVSGPPMAFGGSDAPGNAITIPAVMVSKASGDILIAKLQAGATIYGNLKRSTPPDPYRDGDIDNGVISHEYGHGISNRLTGGPMSTLPLGGDEQGGEGWSDFLALYMTLRKGDLTAPTAEHPNGALKNRSIGNYVTFQSYNGRGIREYPYSTDMSVNPATFGYVKRPDYSETHSVGFVWCTMLFEMLQSFIDMYGINSNVYEGANPTSAKNPPSTAKGNNIATRLVIEGMKLQPTSPTFTEERDAILKADTLLYNGQHSCMIWKAFAKRGLGYSAVSGTNALGDEVESFDVPYSCDANQKRVSIVKRGPIKVVNGKQLTYSITVTNKYNVRDTGIVVTDTLPTGVTFVSGNPAPVVNGQILTWRLNLDANASRRLLVTGKVSLSAGSVQTFGETNDGASSSLVPQNNGGVDTWSLQTDSSQAFSGANYWFVPDTDLGSTNTTLTTTNAVNIPANAELVFIHKYASESTYDGGVVEVSEDNVNWTYLPPNKFVQNGYSTVIPTANTPTIGTADLAAFSGASAGYIVSIAKLDDYVGKNIYIRFRFVADPQGSVPNGGWWLDDVYVLTNRVSITNMATAVTIPGERTTPDEGTNAYSSTTAFVMGSTTGSRPVETVARPSLPTERSFKASIYPNPTDNIANLSITNPSGGDVTITLFDVAGRKLAAFKGGNVETRTIALPVAGLKAGTYWVQLDTQEAHTTLQFIKK